MPLPTSKNSSLPSPKPDTEISLGGKESLWDLNLPEVHPGEEPLPSAGFTDDARLKHAQFLLSIQSIEAAQAREQSRNLEPFIWID